MLHVNPENTVMTASNISELPETIQQFYEYINDGCKIEYYSKLNESRIMLVNGAGQEAIFDLNLLSNYGHIDNEGVLWMGVHKWRFPSLEPAPLFLEREGEIVVIAPCEMPQAMIVGEPSRVGVV